MFRKRQKRNISFGIRTQLMLGLVGVLFVSALFLYWMLDQRLTEGREAQITQELERVRETTELYVRQMLILNEANNDARSFVALAEDISQELGSYGRYEVSVYSRQGTLCAGGKKGPEEPDDKSPDRSRDLEEAVKGNTAYMLNYQADDRLMVYFSIPIMVEEKSLGIIRYHMDYTTLWQQGRETERTVFSTAAAVFAAAFLLLYLLLGGMLKPIQKLTKVSRQMSEDLKGDEINAELLAELTVSARRDEVGELSRDYSAMLNRLGEYIQKMKDDREQILTLLNSRQEFYNNVTHELKTPLTTIQGYAQLIEADGGRDQELLEKGVEHILHESTRLHQMVLELLEMADKNFTETFVPVDLGALARSVAEAMEIKANRYECHIRLNLGEELFVLGLEEKLRQVLINLIDNAIKYGESGAVIGICGKKGQNKVLLSVTNRGGGIQKEQAKHIFEPFYRVDKEYSREQGSAGLGLSICKKIMDEHHAKIWVESEEGGSTTFFLLFREENGEEERP